MVLRYHANAIWSVTRVWHSCAAVTTLSILTADTLPTAARNDILPIVLPTSVPLNEANRCKHIMRVLMLCRLMYPLESAAEAYELLEDWATAANMRHDLALVCDVAGMTEQRNTAAEAWQRLRALSRRCS